jgi:hypothetical protein
MPTYRLEPIEDFLREQSWQYSLLKAACWVKAPDEVRARLALAAATVVPAESVGIMESPWLSPVLTMCIEDSSAVQVEPEIAISVIGVAQAWTVPADAGIPTNGEG